MKIQIGIPPVQVLGVAAIGSDLTWAQCEPCTNCYKQVGPPLLVPASSSTYQAQKCGSKACDQSQFHNELKCDSKNNCQYQMSYGDGSYSIGGIAMDTFWFRPTPFKHVVFGCGHDNNGTFNGNISGIIDSVLVRNNSLSYKQSFSKDDGVFEGNIIVDSGTTLTFLTQEFYSDFISSLTKGIGGKIVKDPQGILDVCYRDLHLDRVPTVTFQFRGGDVELSPVNMFLEVEEMVSCLSIVSDEYPIFGNLLQRNMLAGFDLVNKKISFKPTDCAMQ
ncbi:hypothetical protein L1987_79613 [Smallanthus sonchifolius]|uniref:Uncharacterized protein n=1 Tax=Smallanthus sonchifolius TaxID=185202 RepID=A0ACB8YLV7_9ASTR|nr:hypothetical protein L1987_79613 [Smallanthus sonchifolius]